MLKGAGEGLFYSRKCSTSVRVGRVGSCGQRGTENPPVPPPRPDAGHHEVEEGVVDGRFLPAAVGTEGLTRESGATAGYLRPTAPSLRAWRKACQPGMPFTPPPACVAQEPWYSPRIGVR